jgi:RNA polymerase sigma factor (sigma-70 family)
MTETPETTSDGADPGLGGSNAGNIDIWFAREIVPLESGLVQFLQHHWRDRNDIEDLVQDIYVRIYEAALKEIPDLARRFLFTTARNLLIDKIRRTQIVCIETVSDLEALDVVNDMPGPDRTAIARDELRRLQLALDYLPSQCREVVVLGRLEGLSGREIATRMGITPATVSHHLNRALTMLAAVMHDDAPESRGEI